MPRHSETDIFLRKSSTRYLGRYLGTMYTFLYLAQCQTGWQVIAV